MSQKPIASILILGFIVLALYIGYNLITGIIGNVQTQSDLTDQTTKELLSPNR